MNGAQIKVVKLMNDIDACGKESDMVLQLDVDGDGEPDLSIKINRNMRVAITGGVAALAGVVCQLLF